MPSLKEVRTRIESVNSTRQITSAMKMVAASKLRKSQNAILTMRPYASKLQELMLNLSAHMGDSKVAKFAESRTPDKILLVPVTSNRGLCGAFNASIIRYTLRLAEVKYSSQMEQNNVSVFCVGKKAADFFAKNGLPFLGSEIHVFDHLNFESAAPIAEKLMQLFEDKHFDRIVFIYNQFRSAGSQTIIEEQLLPVELPESSDDDQKPTENEQEYIFEPDQKQILEQLVPRTIKMQVYKLLLDSFASEHGARMIAMHKATDNATEMLKELKLSYNKARQAAITKEILEIVGGADALA